MTPQHRRLVLPAAILFVSLNALLFYTNLHLVSESEHRVLEPPTVQSAVDRPLPKDCQYFVDRAANPGQRFLSANGQIIQNIPETGIPKRISFVHYNARFKNPRYLCALESATRQNPLHSIAVYAKNMSDFDAVLRKVGLSLNVTVLDLRWRDMFASTPLQPWYGSGTYLQSKWVDQNLGNAFRLAVLWNVGGTYLDLDVVSLNPLSGLGRTLANQTGPSIPSNAFFSFPKNDLFVWEMMKEFVVGFNGTVWGRNGPRMVERTYNNICLPRKGEPPVKRPYCNLSIAPREIFFPFSYANRNKSLRPWREHCGTMKTLSDRSIGLHWWNKGMKGADIEVDTTLQAIMRHHCPLVYKTFGAKGLGFFSPRDVAFGKGSEWSGYEENDGF
ncbi:nucleotide-diphospho-sugar transferase [Chytriomyces sp. MP71]|nr:nucleotide-diphospho-sugar transferase [Chytriomyces sp. MP71]